MQCSEAGGCDGQVACLEANSGHVRAWLEEVIEDEVSLPGGLLLELQVTTFVGLLPNENLSGGFPQLPGFHHLKGCVCCPLKGVGRGLRLTCFFAGSPVHHPLYAMLRASTDLWFLFTVGKYAMCHNCSKAPIVLTAC